MSTFCGQHTATAQPDAGIVIGTLLRCGSWRCTHCSPRNRAQLLKRLSFAPGNKLLTLTCNPAIYSSADAATRHMSLAIPKLIKRLRRRFPRSAIRYFLVWELTRNHWPHAHLLLDAPYVPQALLSRIWADLTGSRIVDVRAVPNKRYLHMYLAKYLTKAPSVPPHMKVWRQSLRFLPPRPQGPLAGLDLYRPWLLHPGALAPIAASLHASGWTLTCDTGTLLIATLNSAPNSPPDWPNYPYARNPIPWPSSSQAPLSHTLAAK